MKEVTVRIAVVVNADGVWNALGWSSARDDNDMMATCLDGVESMSSESRFWIEATLPLPVEETIIGKATVAFGTEQK